MGDIAYEMENTADFARRGGRRRRRGSALTGRTTAGRAARIAGGLAALGVAGRYGGAAVRGYRGAKGGTFLQRLNAAKGRAYGTAVRDVDQLRALGSRALKGANMKNLRRAADVATGGFADAADYAEFRRRRRKSNRVRNALLVGAGLAAAGAGGAYLGHRRGSRLGFRAGARAGLLRGRKRASENFTPSIAGNNNVFPKAVPASQQRTDRRDFFPPV